MDPTESLYRRLLAVREAGHYEQLTTATERSVLRMRVRAAYHLITERGMRRAQRDEVYAAVRRRLMQQLGEEEASDVFDAPSEDVFTELMEHHPQWEGRLRDMAHEFGVALRPGHAEERRREGLDEAKQRVRAASAEASRAAPLRHPLWQRLRATLSAYGLSKETIDSIIEDARKPDDKAERVWIKNSDSPDQGSPVPDAE